MTLVVDASVGFKWFAEEALSEPAKALLTVGDSLIAPDLLVCEVCNALRSKVARRQLLLPQAEAAVRALPAMLDELAASSLLVAKALEIANQLAHPAYDCFYVALAELRGARLVTADRRLVSRLVETPWSALVIELGAELP